MRIKEGFPAGGGTSGDLELATGSLIDLGLTTLFAAFDSRLNSKYIGPNVIICL
jgi:hypothetical protein